MNYYEQLQQMEKLMRRQKYSKPSVAHRGNRETRKIKQPDRFGRGRKKPASQAFNVFQKIKQ